MPEQAPVRTPESCKTRDSSLVGNLSLARMVAHLTVRLFSFSQCLNPGLRGMLRDVGSHRRAGCALVARAVHGTYAIPIRIAERQTSITLRGGEQQDWSDELA